MTSPKAPADSQRPGGETFVTDAPVANLRRSAASGAALIGTSQLIKIVAQFASVIVIARLIGPEQIGISAMVAPLLALALLFQDLGLGQATVQASQISHRQLNSLFWIGVGISLVLALALTIVSPFVAQFYHTPEVMPLTIAVACLTILSNAGAQPLALLNRAMKFSTIAVIEIAAAIGSLGGSILVAILTKSYWAIYAANLLAVGITTLMAFAAARWMPSFPKIAGGVRSLVHFGVGTSVFNLANLVSRNLNSVLIGRVWGELSLGLYDRGHKLLLLPLQQAFLPVARVMVPVLSRLQDEPERYRSAFLRCQRVTLIAVQPGVVVLLVFAPELVTALLGARWAGTGEIFRALGGAGLTVTLNSSITWLFASQGRGGELAKWGLFNAATTIVASVLAIPHGVLVVAYVYSAGELARAPIFWWLATRSGPLCPRHAVGNVLYILATVPVYAGVAFLVRQSVDAPVLVTVALAVIATYGAAVLQLLLTAEGRVLFRDMVAMVSGILGKMARAKSA